MKYMIKNLWLTLIQWFNKYSNGKFDNYIQDSKLSQLLTKHLSDSVYVYESEKDWVKSENGYRVKINPFTRVGDENLALRLSLLSFKSIKKLIKSNPGRYKFTIYIRCYVDKNGKTGSGCDFVKYKKAKVIKKRKTFNNLIFDSNNLNSHAFSTCFYSLFKKFCEQNEVFDVIELNISADKLD